MYRKMEYIEIPKNLSEKLLIEKFGKDAVDFYERRLKERERDGNFYPKKLKTIYIWATQDKRTNQGFYSTYCGFANGRKRKNYGRS